MSILNSLSKYFLLKTLKRCKFFFLQTLMETERYSDWYLNEKKSLKWLINTDTPDLEGFF